MRKLIIAAAVGALLLLSGCGVFRMEEKPAEQTENQIPSTEKAAETDSLPAEEIRPEPTETGADGSAEENSDAYAIPRLETRYYLKNLSPSELEFCGLVYSSAIGILDDILVPEEMNISFEDADRLVSYVLYDCPELIMCSGGYSIHGAKTVNKIRLVYRMDKREYERQASELEAVLAELEAVCSGMSDYDAELYIHDKICNTCTYSSGSEFCDSAYGALVAGSALCQGYTKAFQLAMQRLGRVCLLVSSEKMVHSWNIVLLDGAFYQLDLTWDDSGDHKNYAYFNIDDERSAAFGHVYDRLEGVEYPVCGSMALNYYVLNGTYIRRDADVKTMFLAALDAMYPSGGELELMFESADDLRQMIADQGDWISVWNADKYLSIRFTRTILENNDYVYIARFEFDET